MSFKYIGYAAFDLAVDTIQSANFLTGEQKRDILYNKVVRFLELDEKTHAPTEADKR
jgi:hypothetical protein